LQLDRHYFWILEATVYSGTIEDRTSETQSVKGWVTRIDSSSTDTVPWHDELTDLAEKLLLDPNNVQLKEKWHVLLKKEKLEEVAKQPLIGGG
jgi:hypothetical protein